MSLSKSRTKTPTKFAIISLAMSWLRNGIYATCLLAFSPIVITKAIRHGKYREGWLAKLFGQVPLRESKRPCGWFHAVSVGEVRVLERIVAAFELEYPGWDVVVTTTTKTGMELARRQFEHHQVCYLPFDFSWAVKRFIRRKRPSCLVLAELEIWPNLLLGINQAGLKVAVVNARLSDRSFRGYRLASVALRSTFRRIDLVCCQTADDARRFERLGVPARSVVVTGSVKFDGVETDRNNAQTKRLAAIANIVPGETIWVAGSTQPEEEAMAVSVFERLTEKWPNLRLILVPRHPERFDESEARLKGSGLRYAKRSQWELTNNDQKTNDQKWQVLLVDSIGELSHWWGVATISFVGGSFGKRGGQNMIEPAAYGSAVCYGPNTGNFRDVVRRLRDEQAALTVTGQKSLEQFVDDCLESPSYLEQIGSRARECVMSQQGATDKTIDLLCELISGRSNHVPRIADQNSVEHNNRDISEPQPIGDRKSAA